MKHKELIITLAALGAVIVTIVMIVGFVYMTDSEGKKDKADTLAYYQRDDCYINVTATVTNEEHNDDNYYRIYLQYDEQNSDLRLGEYYDIIPSIAQELQKNDFDFSAFDKRYVFTIGRRRLYHINQSFPVLAIREVDDGGKVYLDYETGKRNLLLYLSSKK